MYYAQVLFVPHVAAGGGAGTASMRPVIGNGGGEREIGLVNIHPKGGRRDAAISA